MNKHAGFADEEIINKIVINQEKDLFSLLYVKYFDKVYHKCFSIVKCDADARELVQDIFLKAMVNLHGFRNHSSFSTWLYAITHNDCMAYLRSTRRHGRNQADQPVETSEIMTQEQEDVFDLRNERMTQVLDLLPPSDKAILEKKYRDGLKISAIMNFYNLSESAAKMKIKRAKVKALSIYCSLFPE